MSSMDGKPYHLFYFVPPIAIGQFKSFHSNDTVNKLHIQYCTVYNVWIIRLNCKFLKLDDEEKEEEQDSKGNNLAYNNKICEQQQQEAEREKERNTDGITKT